MEELNESLKKLEPPLDVVENRRAICSECPSSKLGFCMECGCFILAKTMRKAQACPLNKWQSVN